MSLLKQVIEKVAANNGNYQLPYDNSQSRSWYGPFSIMLLGLVGVLVRYTILSKPVSAEAWQSIIILLLYCVIGFFVLPLIGTQIARFGERTTMFAGFFKIFGLPFLFLGFLALLIFLP